MKAMKKILIFCCLVVGCVPVWAQRINTASLNVRYENRQDSLAGNAWSDRCPMLCEVIRYHDFDIFGAQEVLDKQLTDLLSGLPGYSYTGVGRDDGNKAGEYAPIFYKADVFSLISSGVFWLSETPDVPSRGWDARYPRICTWGYFLHEMSGKKLWVFNTHFDHIGVNARYESVKQILGTIRSMTQGETVILTGDFNVDQTAAEYTLFADSGIVKDCYHAADICHARNGTTNGFDTNSVSESRIDHIYASLDCKVLRYGILTDLYWPDTDPKEETADCDVNFPKEIVKTRRKARTPSDHYPVAVQIMLP